MKKRIVFVHSAGDQGPDEGSDKLVSYLKKELAPHFLEAPKMPEPENPRSAAWMDAVAAALNKEEAELLLIGHSLGGSILLKYLSENAFTHPIAALFLVSTPFWGKKDWEIEEYELEPHFAQQLPPIGRVFLYHSKDDEWVPFSHMGQYLKKLNNATTRVIEGDQHEFDKGLPELVEDIKSVLITSLNN